MTARAGDSTVRHARTSSDPRLPHRHESDHGRRRQSRRWRPDRRRSLSPNAGRPAAAFPTVALTPPPPRVARSRRGGRASPVRLAPCRTVGIARPVCIGAGARAAAVVRERRPDRRRARDRKRGQALVRRRRRPTCAPSPTRSRVSQGRIDESDRRCGHVRAQRLLLCMGSRSGPTAMRTRPYRPRWK